MVVVKLNDDQFGSMAHDLSTPGGGFTVNVHTGQPVSEGWAVAHHGHEAWAPASHINQGLIKGYVAEHGAALDKAGHIGGWHDPDDKRADLDTVEVHPKTYHGAAKAIAAGYEHNQMAIQELGGDWNTVRMRPGESHDMRNRREAGTASPEEARAQALGNKAQRPAQVAANRQALNSIRKQRPGGEAKIADLPTKQLGQMFRDRRPI